MRTAHTQPRAYMEGTTMSQRATGKASPAGRRTPPTVKGRDARRRLLTAGTDVFGHGGYARARVQDITAAAGLSPGAFYRYFTDKHHLLLVLLEEMLTEAWTEARAPWDAEHPEVSVRVTTERYFAFYDRNRALMGTMVEMAQNDPEILTIWRKSRTAFYQRIGRALARGVGAGVVRDDIDVDLAAELLGSMTEFYAFQRYALGDDSIKHVPAEEVAQVLTEIWSRGVVISEK